MWDSILNLIFPPRCEVCKSDSKEALCQTCFQDIKFMKPHLGIYSIAVYDGALRTAIHRFKFKGKKRLAEPLGIIMVKYLSQAPMLEMKEIDVIIPVPLHKKRLRQRGFNQAELLGNVLSRYYGTSLVSALERVNNTQAQFDLPRQERFNNITGAFKVVDSQSVYNKRVLLLDDIYTTGATIAECSKVLKIAGAKRVEVMTLSRAVDS
ncbi:MAG: ComF family protein [Candidatus Margulisbacteria bacterium]|nr:ComF family protein [Candidatus Margulisiibacteriota bacterium]